MTAAPVLDLACMGLSRAADGFASAARVARFLRNRARFEPRRDDIYVASYPRSGTTLTQMIVHLLTSDGRAEFDHITEVSPWWERSLAWRDGAAAELDDLPAPRVFKTHLLRRWLPRDARCIYVERDGRDVAVSYYHLYRSHLGYTDSFERFWQRFLDGRLQYGSWFRHIASWRRAFPDRQVLWLRFEELLARRRQTVETIAEFLNIDASAAQLQRVCELTSFDAMKAIEDKFDHAGEILYQRGIARGRFIRAGRTDQHTGYLTPAQLAAFDHHRGAHHEQGEEWRLHEFLR